MTLAMTMVMTMVMTDDDVDNDRKEPVQRWLDTTDWDDSCIVLGVGQSMTDLPESQPPIIDEAVPSSNPDLPPLLEGWTKRECGLGRGRGRGRASGRGNFMRKIDKSTSLIMPQKSSKSGKLFFFSLPFCFPLFPFEPFSCARLFLGTNYIQTQTWWILRTRFVCLVFAPTIKSALVKAVRVSNSLSHCCHFHFVWRVKLSTFMRRSKKCPVLLRI